LKLVEFWVLFGSTRVEIYYPDGSVEIRSISDFNEDTIEPSLIDKVLVFINSNDLIAKLEQYITDNTRECIEDLIKEIRKMQLGVPERQSSLDDFFVNA
jgi:hypothetical protein